MTMTEHLDTIIIITDGILAINYSLGIARFCIITTTEFLELTTLFAGVVHWFVGPYNYMHLYHTVW